MGNEERAIELVESAREKLARAAGYVPDLADEFEDTIRCLEDLVDDLEEEVDDGEEAEDEDTD